MEFLRRIFAAIYKTWMFLTLLIPALLFLPLYITFLNSPKLLNAAFKLVRLHSFLILTCSGIIVRRKYHIPTDKIPSPCIYIANHTSYLDILSSYMVIPNFFVFMAKAELDKIPIFNLFFKHMNVLVNRKSKMDSHKAFIKIGEKLDQGFSVYIFPEGTISNEGKLKQFKNGAFKLAIDKQIPIVPIVYRENWKLLQNGGYFKSYGRPGVIYADVLEPIYTNGLKDENLLDLRLRIQNLFEENIKNSKQ
ncbi:MAG: lysophospholipid acyltransferase family protein [Bacteroidota bacterium]|jgi:1-acyl-sn-glycerol-3-phosphate acyltransferase